MKKTEQDPNGIGTIGELIATLVRGFNTELRGNGRVKKVPKISTSRVIRSVLVQARVDQAALDREFSVNLIGEAMQVVARYGVTKYGIPFSTPLDEVSASGVGQMIVSIVTADAPMDVTPRTYLRRPSTIKRIVELTTVFGAACLHTEVADAAEESGADADEDFTPEEHERFRWMAFLEAVFGSEASSAIYARFRAGLKEGEFAAFTAGLRRQVGRSDDALRRYGMTELAINAMKYVGEQAGKNPGPAHPVAAASGSGSPKKTLFN